MLLLVLEQACPSPRSSTHEDTLGTDDGQSPGRGRTWEARSPEQVHKVERSQQPPPWCHLWGGAGQRLEA